MSAGILESFVAVGPLSGHTRTVLLPHLPESLQRFLGAGVGYLGDGMMRTVDPVTIGAQTSRLAAPIHASHAVPIATSAFADVVFYWQSRLYLINSRHGRYIGLGRVSRLAQILTEITGPATREFLLGPTPWAQAVTAFGVPTPTECFAYVPPLAVRPRATSELEGVVRAGLGEHLEFLATFHGPAQGRW